MGSRFLSLLAGNLRPKLTFKGRGRRPNFRLCLSMAVPKRKRMSSGYGQKQARKIARTLRLAIGTSPRKISSALQLCSGPLYPVTRQNLDIRSQQKISTTPKRLASAEHTTPQLNPGVFTKSPVRNALITLSRVPRRFICAAAQGFCRILWSIPGRVRYISQHLGSYALGLFLLPLRLLLII